MNKVKNSIYAGIAVLIVFLAVSLAVETGRRKSAERKWEDAMENVKFYSGQFSASDSRNRAMRITTEQLKHSSDSILQKLNDARLELKVKDSRLQAMDYAAATFTKCDTITMRDTIFRDSCLDIDTVVSDRWYSLEASLKYPSTIAVKPEFRSEKFIVVSMKRETVNPPKKFFLLRWFQKKHNVLNVDVVERNPYVREQTHRFVEIVK